MKFTRKYLFAICLLALSSTVYASNAEMNTTLARINTTLNQINPLINLAKQQENTNARVKFQFDALRNDISRIQSGILKAINRVSIQQRTVTPLFGDYLPTQNSLLKQQPIIQDEKQ